MLKKEQKKYIDIGILILIIGLILIIIWLLTFEKESISTTEPENTNYASLECTSSSPTNPFFSSSTVQRFTHEIKVLISNNKIKEMSYRYDGTFNSSDAAESARAWMHTDYNKYMQANNVYQEILNPVFSVQKSKVTVSLYAESKKINLTVARLFFIDENDFESIDDYTAEDLKKLYESKGFSCQNYD